MSPDKVSFYLGCGLFGDRNNHIMWRRHRRVGFYLKCRGIKLYKMIEGRNSSLGNGLNKMVEQMSTENR